MPGYVLHENAVCRCVHAGQATITASEKKVFVSGQPVASQSSQTTVAGCPFQLSTTPPKPQPCVSIRWSMLSQRVMVMSQPLVIVPSPGPAPGMCSSAEQIPQGPPTVSTLQTRVLAS